ncbi:acid protease [Fomitiporia mediterranea MF3/22]|uniref:acid protease n=1 Tax=Fomitiporia mediterranea (strain MF3/22) TaxID=694068 RepID=UPI0004407D60|nr:acid protease [Fomitiporia mediterranea MF3/22]EJD06572.1 acid protease [Fomitiporia mediterranea MF3/22]
MLASLPLILLFFLLDTVVAYYASSSAPGIRSAEAPPTELLKRLSAPSGLKRRDFNPANASSTVLGLTLSDDRSSYYTIIQAGNISFRVAVDTASSDFWLLASTCSGSDVCKSSPSYPLLYHSPSFGAVNGNQSAFSLSFADGSSSSGFLATETVQLGNLSNVNQVFGLVNSTNVKLDSDISGVLGMGFPRLSSFSSTAVNATPFVNSLAQQGALDYPLFGLSLTRDDGGTIALGAIDVNVVHNLSAIEWHKVLPFSPFNSETNTSSYLQWVVRLPEVGINGTNLNTQPTYPNITEQSLALIDAGTNGIFGPYQDVSRIFEAFGEARLVDATVGQWAVPCDTQITLSFNFGQGNLTLQPTDYLIGPVSGNPTSCLAWPRAVQNSGDGIDWQLGTPFLRTVYSIFSYGIDGKEVPMIGFYPLTNTTAITQTPQQISSFFSSFHLTIATTLPNSLLSTPSATTAPYIFNTSIPASVGAIVTSGLGDDNYSAILMGDPVNINTSALPVITPPPTLVTLIVTDKSGAVLTSVEHVPTSSIALGVPPGQSSSGFSLFFGRGPIVEEVMLVVGVGLVCGMLFGL